MFVPDGFPGQRMRVLPTPLIVETLKQRPAASLLVTDCGYFPRAAGHGRTRRRGVSAAIVIVCSDGVGFLQLPGQRLEVQAGDVVIVPPGSPHQYYADTDDPWTIWWMHVAGTEVLPLLRAALPTMDHPLIHVRDVSVMTALIGDIIARMSTNESPATLLAAAGSAWHLLALLGAERTTRDDRQDPIAEALRYLGDHIGSRIKVADLANRAGLSSSHFAALFAERTGFSVIHYQTRQRMARARELLDTTELSITDIALQVGYEDPFYFSRRFSRLHAMSPSAYRARAEWTGTEALSPATHPAHRPD